MKVNKDKWIFLLALPLILLGQLGCKKFLDRKPLGGAIDGDVAQGAVEEQVLDCMRLPVTGV